MSADLAGELFDTQGALTNQQRDTLLSAGVAGECIAWGWVGTATALIERDTWQPCTVGARVFVVPVRVADPLSPEWKDPDEVVRFGELVDLVAFTLDRPDRWALRTGNAQWLGAIGPQFFMPDPVGVHRHPLGWLRASGTGLVPLSRKPDEIRSLLLGCYSIAAEDVQHGRELRRLLERPFPIPEIVVPARAGRRAA